MNPHERHRYFAEAGYPPTSGNPPADPEQRRAFEETLAGVFIAAGLCVLILIFLNTSFGPPSMTARMERVVQQLDGMKEISPETAQAIERLVSQPGYDCYRVSCDAQLTARNGAVRAQLSSLLAKKRLTSEDHIKKSPIPMMITSSAKDP